MALLSVIIPFGLSKERPYIEERVIEKAKYFKSDENIEFIFVEGYSSKNHELKKSKITFFSSSFKVKKYSFT